MKIVYQYKLDFRIVCNDPFNAANGTKVSLGSQYVFVSRANGKFDGQPFKYQTPTLEEQWTPIACFKIKRKPLFRLIKEWIKLKTEQSIFLYNETQYHQRS